MNSSFIKYVTYQATEVKTLDEAVYKWFHTCYVNWEHFFISLHPHQIKYGDAIPGR